MSELALMFLKPEFTLSEREEYFPIIKNYLERYGLNIEKNVKVYSYENKKALFDAIYSTLLKHAYQLQSGDEIGSFEYLNKFSSVSNVELFKEWISPENPAFKIENDRYFIKKENLKVINPFCPYQRKMFINVPVPVHLFLIRKNKQMSWSELKARFQGKPVQRGIDRQGIRSHLSRCSWYTSTTNGIHLSATDREAVREVQIVRNFFTYGGM